MAGGRFSKQADYQGSKWFNTGTGDATVGGALTTAPGGLVASQGEQTQPGDRIIFSPSDALAVSNNNVGNLYSGTFRYVGTRNNSSSSPARAHAAFWDLTALGANNIGSSATDQTYQTTSDQAANIGVSLFAGVYINNITAGNWWWVQESGKVACKFLTAITGTPAIGAPVYLAAGGNNNNAADIGSFDQLDGANSAAIFTANSTTGYTTVGQMINRYVGPAETLPSNNNITLVDLTLARAGFRW